MVRSAAREATSLRVCPCYDASERTRLYDGCLATCETADGAGILVIAKGQPTCSGLVGIIKTLNADFKTGCIGTPPN